MYLLVNLDIRSAVINVIHHESPGEHIKWVFIPLHNAVANLIQKLLMKTITKRTDTCRMFFIIFTMLVTILREIFLKEAMNNWRSSDLDINKWRWFYFELNGAKDTGCNIVFKRFNLVTVPKYKIWKCAILDSSNIYRRGIRGTRIKLNISMNGFTYVYKFLPLCLDLFHSKYQ